MLKININSQYRNVKPKVNIANSWKDIGQAYINDGGIWKPIFNLNWNISSWGTCSVNCGGGVQYRTVTCLREDGLLLPDNLCVSKLGTKPTISQVCNTQACQPVGTCQYINNGSEPMYFWATAGEYVIICWGTILNNGSYVVGPDGTTTVNGYKYYKGTFMTNGAYGPEYQVCRVPV